MIIGVGVDIIEISRIKKSIDKFGDNFINHIFTDDEIKYVKKYKNPIQHYAVRFAAKEAIYKALGNSKISWKDISIYNDKNGRPYCRILKLNPNNKIHISLSHSHDYAVANAIVEKT